MLKDHGVLKKAAGALVAAVGVASCSAGGPTAGGPTAAVKHQTYIYTCCRASDISQPLHPGQALTIHWIVKPGPLSDLPKATTITLKASLTGPYRSVTSLKSAGLGRGGGTVTFTAGPVTTTDWAGGHPVTRIAIPATAAIGLYNLDTSMVSASGSSSGASIVRVTAAG